MPAPPSSHPIRIKVYGIDNQVISGVTVVLTLNSETIEGTTNSSGEVVLNTANLTSGWNVGDEVSIVTSKTGAGTKTETLTLTASPQTLSMTLAETSDYEWQDMGVDNAYVLNFVIPTTYDGEKVTYSNPLPVAVVDNGLNSNRGYKIARAYNASNQVLYLGKALAGTGKDEAKWQIIKHTYSGNKPADTLFAGGSDAFSFIWNNRTTYDYS